MNLSFSKYCSYNIFIYNFLNHDNISPTKVPVTHKKILSDSDIFVRNRREKSTSDSDTEKFFPIRNF